MPLLDHFRPPLNEEQFWESFHTLWISAIVERLNGGLLPEGYRAQANVHLGEVAVDVGAFSRSDGGSPGGDWPTEWRPSAAALAVPVVYPDELEVRVFSTRSGPTLVAALELVSPRNKDRPAARRAFAAKCVAYLSQGVGLIVADVVTERRANLHDEIIRLLDLGHPYLFPPDTPIYAAAYWPTATAEAGPQVDLWREPLRLGGDLPVLPLALRGNGSVRVDLEASYTDARRRSRL